MATERKFVLLAMELFCFLGYQVHEIFASSSRVVKEMSEISSSNRVLEHLCEIFSFSNRVLEHLCEILSFPIGSLSTCVRSSLLPMGT